MSTKRFTAVSWGAAPYQRSKAATSQSPYRRPGGRLQFACGRRKSTVGGRNSSNAS